MEKNILYGNDPRVEACRECLLLECIGLQRGLAEVTESLESGIELSDTRCGDCQLEPDEFDVLTTGLMFGALLGDEME